MRAGMYELHASEKHADLVLTKSPSRVVSKCPNRAVSPILPLCGGNISKATIFIILADLSARFRKSKIHKKITKIQTNGFYENS